MGTHRRTVLLAGTGALAAAAAGVAGGVLPGRARALHTLHVDGSDGAVPDVPGGRTLRGSFRSAHRLGAECGWAAVLPPAIDLSNADDLPIVLALHGRGSTHATVIDRSGLGLGSVVADGMRRGLAPLVVAAVDGGDTYWHPRASGEDAGAMVVEEFVPLLRRLGLRGPLLLWGWSMGGFGALRLAGLLGEGGAPAVAALSPALFRSFEEASSGAFDDAADLARNTVLGRQSELDGIAVRVDCGAGDPFSGAVEEYRSGFTTTPAGGIELGDHDLGYWRGLAPTQMAFLAERTGDAPQVATRRSR